MDLGKFVGKHLNVTYIDGETVSGKCVLYVPAKDNDGKKAIVLSRGIWIDEDKIKSIKKHM
jgi:hypothetical protein